MTLEFVPGLGDSKTEPRPAFLCLLYDHKEGDPMSATFSNVRVGQPIRHEQLSVFPLFSDVATPVDYVLAAIPFKLSWGMLAAAFLVGSFWSE